MPAPCWLPVYIGIGSNLDGPEQQVQSALEALAALPRTFRINHSGIRRNAPLGSLAQPDYFNAVAGLLTQLQPEELLDQLLGIERRQGRDRSTSMRWGPRRIDLDLLVYGDVEIQTERLVVPHPGIASRNFVLFPLLEIAPGLRVPGRGPVWRLAAALSQEEQQAWETPVTSRSKAR